MKKVIEDQYVFKRDFKVRQNVNDVMQTGIFCIRYELQISIEKNIIGETRKENNCCMLMDWNIAHYESYGKINK